MPSRQKIVHCFRSPVGGIFRNVRDLIEAQVAKGHQIGILCDSATGGNFEDALFKALEPHLALGLHRITMRRRVGLSDIIVLWRAFRHLAALKPDVIHSHGAKGGAYGRLIGTLMGFSGSKVARLYCPHGGSIHFDEHSLQGRIYFTLERFLEHSTDRLIFVSNYEKQGYFEKIGKPKCPYSLVYNGLQDSEFEPVKPAANAADLLFIGMMRDLKGPDVFIDALPIVEDKLNRKISAHLVGNGPDREQYLQTVDDLGLTDRVKFHPPMPAREAFAMARTVVVPSRAESLPYIILEAIAAAKPLISTNVGGIPEIFNEESSRLIPAGDSVALATAMIEMANNPDAEKEAGRLAQKIRGRFSASTMAESIDEAYEAASR